MNLPIVSDLAQSLGLVAKLPRDGEVWINPSCQEQTFHGLVNIELGRSKFKTSQEWGLHYWHWNTHDYAFYSRQSLLETVSGHDICNPWQYFASSIEEAIQKATALGWNIPICYRSGSK